MNYLHRFGDLEIKVESYATGFRYHLVHPKVEKSYTSPTFLKARLLYEHLFNSMQEMFFLELK